MELLLPGVQETNFRLETPLDYIPVVDDPTATEEHTEDIRADDTISDIRSELQEHISSIVVFDDNGEEYKADDQFCLSTPEAYFEDEDSGSQVMHGYYGSDQMVVTPSERFKTNENQTLVETIKRSAVNLAQRLRSLFSRKEEPASDKTVLA